MTALDFIMSLIWLAAIVSLLGWLVVSGIDRLAEWLGANAPDGTRRVHCSTCLRWDEVRHNHDLDEL